MAYTFNGSTQYLSISDTSFFDVGTGDFSVFMRVNKDAASIRKFLISKRVDADNFFEFEWEADNNIFLRMRIATTVEIEVENATALSASTDYRLLWVIDRDSSANTEIYVNGSVDTTGTPIVSTTDLDIAAATALGRWQGDGFYFDGVISEFALWKGVVLSQSDANKLEKFSPEMVRPAALTHYASLVRELRDVVGGATIVNNNSAVVSAHPPVIRSSAPILQFPSAGAAIWEQEGFRWRDDDGSESAATWRQNQDVDDTIAKETNIRLRVLSDSINDAASVTRTLQYKRDDEAASEWRDV